ncbi:MAG: prephenate dehydratase [Pseudomonadales bacterium]|nr:prephenate dehydratase [Pseudomonadales bacterium]
MRTLNEVRARINALDDEIMDLISQRARCAQEVAEIKRHDDPSTTVFYRPEREAQVLERIMANNSGPLAGEDMARLFREIMSACLALEQPLRVAFLGPAGTFTQTAALKHFGHAVQSVPLATIDEVFRDVEAGAVNYGVVPVENSSEGVVNHTLDSFMTSGLCIMGEVELRIHHHFLVADVTKVAAISRIYSHQQSLAQCRKWLDAHFPGAERVALPSNAEAARRIRGEWHSAAIAGETAGALYDLQTLHACIEDNPNNTTRFLIIGREEVVASGRDKTSIMVSVQNGAGALYRVLEPFNRQDISLTRIETRPSQIDIWSYVFFIDFEGHQSDPIVQSVFAELRAGAAEVKILGSYPRAVL